MNIKFNPRKKILTSSSYDTEIPKINLKTIQVIGDYIILDQTMRRYYRQNEHEYIIEQIQQSVNYISTDVEVDIKMEFKYPIRELVWVIQDSVENSYANTYNYWNNGIKSYSSLLGTTTTNLPTTAT